MIPTFRAKTTISTFQTTMPTTMPVVAAPAIDVG